eukprot:GFUD01022374.1.p1 GENE.GFUD01022374.1~~GFUD01022374.1.p1  ORF type:complete len:337 (-),score=67.02 GFUD01022374.1:496-1506(-)
MGKGTGPAAAEPENLGGTAIKPVGWDRTGLEAFKYLLYNPDTGEVLTRTPLSWLKITVFYAVYYSFLTAFWLGCLNIFFLTLPEVTSGPKWTMEASIIGTNPGVGLRPASTNKRIDSQMFVLKKGDTNKVGTDEHGEGDLNIDYAIRMQKFLEVYTKEASAGYESFDLASLDECQKFPYGFIGTEEDKEVSPCIFIKFNKIWDWKPTPLNATDLEDPEDLLPEAVKEHVKVQEDKDNVWINCDGRYPADKEALKDMKYFPASRAIPAKYFPFNGGKANADFNGGKNYHSPLVAIKIKPTTVGQLIHVECRAYFQGVKHDTKHKLGLVQFEVMITEN